MTLSQLALGLCVFVFVAGFALGGGRAARRFPRLAKSSFYIQLAALGLGYLTLRPGEGVADAQAEIDAARADGQPIFLAFHSNNCGPCLLAKPSVDALEADWSDELRVARIDATAERNRSVNRAFRIRGYPTFVLLSPKGEVLHRQFGGRPDRSELDPLLRQYAKSH